VSFALPFALLLGVLLAGPIIAHFVRRAETPIQKLPTFRLLERALAESNRRRRLDDPWLFAARALLVLLATLAAAAPFVWVPIELGDGRACSMVVVVDGSRSMLARDGTTPLVEVARDRAVRALEGLPRGSEQTLVFATNPPTVLADRVSSGEAAANAARRIDAASAVYGDSLFAAIELGIRRLHGSSLAVRRLVVYSDFARHVDLHALDVPRGIEVEFVRVSPSDVRNASVALDSVRIDDADRRNRIVRALVRGYGFERASRVSLDVDGTTATSSPVTIRDTPEYLELRARAGDDSPSASLAIGVGDALPEDDRFDFRLRTPRETRVLFVDGEPGTNRFDDEVGLAARALELVPEGERRFEATRVDAGAVDDAMLDRHDVVVLANVATVTPVLAATLVRRVRAGLGLLVAPGDRTDGRALSQALAAILPARLGLFGRCDERRGIIRRDAPAAIVISGLDGVVHRGCTEIDPQLGRSRTALARNDGSPFFVVSQVERGRVGVLGVALDPEGSDLPLRPGFMPFLSTSLGYLDGSSTSSAEFVVAGSVVDFGDEPVRVRTPSGAFLTKGANRAIGPLRELGPHIVLRNDVPDDDASFTVIAPASESDLRPGPVPTGRREGRESNVSGRLARDVSAPFFALIGFAILGEGALRNLQRGRRRALTTRSTPP